MYFRDGFMGMAAANGARKSMGDLRYIGGEGLCIPGLEVYGDVDIVCLGFVRRDSSHLMAALQLNITIQISSKEPR